MQKGDQHLTKEVQGRSLWNCNRFICKLLWVHEPTLMMKLRRTQFIHTNRAVNPGETGEFWIRLLDFIKAIFWSSFCAIVLPHVTSGRNCIKGTRLYLIFHNCMWIYNSLKMRSTLKSFLSFALKCSSVTWKWFCLAIHSCHGIWSCHFVANRWGNSGNSGWLYFGGLQNHCRWWLQPWN